LNDDTDERRRRGLTARSPGELRNIGGAARAISTTKPRQGRSVKVQILLDNQVIATQIVSVEGLSSKPTLSDIKRIALRAALEDRTIRISESLRATFRLFEVNGDPVEDNERNSRRS